MKRLLGTVVAGGLLLASCSLFETTVNRDLRAVWSPDGAGLLVVGSQYTTLHPEEPYFNATSGHDWQVILETADVNAANPLAARTPLDSFAEGGEAAPVAQGGDAQYNPVYWYPELKRVIFTGPLAQVRDVVAHTSWMVPLPPSEPLTGQLAAALGTVNEVEASLTPALVASEMGLLEAVPSPDGKVLAAVYGVSYRVGDAIGGLIYLYPVVVFWDLSTLKPSGATRVSTDVWQELRNLEPYREVYGAADNYSKLAWKSDASGVWVYLSSTDDNKGVTHSKQVIFVSATGGASPAATVPGRPLPTASGPVSLTGKGYALIQKELGVTELQAKNVDGWTSFGAQPQVDVATWGATSGENWGFF